MIELGFILAIWFFVATVLNRDKKDRKALKAIGEQIKKEEKRRAREEKLHSVRLPGVIYLADRRSNPPQRGSIA